MARLFSPTGAVRLLCILLLQGFFVSEAQTQGGTVGITVSKTEVSVDEAGGTDTYTVVLDSQPTGTIRVRPRSSNRTVATVSPAQLTFTSTNWMAPQMVTVTGVDDAIDNPIDRTATVTHRAFGGGYGAALIDQVRVTATDDDGPPGVMLSRTALRVPEDGGIGTYRVVLGSRPTGDVTIRPVSRNPRVATVSDPLTFRPDTWNVPQMVTVTGVRDSARNDPDRRTTVTHEVSGGGYGGVDVAELTVTATDEYTAWVRVSTNRLDVVEADGAATYRVFLSKQPTAEVTVTPVSGDRTVATVSDTLAFTPTNWNIPQIVTVRGVDDNTINAPNRTTTVTHRASGGGYNGVAVTGVVVTAIDNDRAGMTLSSGRLSLVEGRTRTYQVVLDSPPTANVTVTPSSSHPNVATVSPPELTFTTANWNQPQNVTVTGVDDTIINDPEQRRVVITHRAASDDAAYDGLVVTNEATVRNDDMPGATLSRNGFPAAAMMMSLSLT